MTITITLSDEIEKQLQRKAEEQRRSMEELALEILSDALESDNLVPEPEEVVAKIQALPPNPHGVRPASGSLADALRDAPEDPDFNLATWTQAWKAAEAEMEAITRADDVAEGRR